MYVVDICGTIGYTACWPRHLLLHKRCSPSPESRCQSFHAFILICGNIALILMVRKIARSCCCCYAAAAAAAAGAAGAVGWLGAVVSVVVVGVVVLLCWLNYCWCWCAGGVGLGWLLGWLLGWCWCYFSVSWVVDAVVVVVRVFGFVGGCRRCCFFCWC